MKPSFRSTSKRARRYFSRRKRAIWIGVSVISFSMGLQSQAANDPAVSGPTGTETYSGNQSSGINVVSSSVFTLKIKDLIGGINPGSGVTGVNFRSNNAGDLRVESGLAGSPFNITTDKAAGIRAVSVGSAPTPGDDPFLKIPIPTSATVQGGVVSVENAAGITTTGNKAEGIVAQSSTRGYPAAVETKLKDFVDTGKAAGFEFKVTGGTGADGTGADLGDEVTASLLDDEGEIVAGASAGSFKFDAAGQYTFDAGDAFEDLADGKSVNVQVAVKVEGENPDGGKKADSGVIVVKVTKSGSSFTTETIGSEYAEFGPSGTVFPDLEEYVSALLSSASAGAGNSVDVTNRGVISTSGAESHGIVATSQGGRGGNGRDASVSSSSTRGGNGSQGGAVRVVAEGSITTSGSNSAGVLAWSTGGNGGTGGDSGYFRNSKAGGAGATGGEASVTGSGRIETSGFQSSGILAVSQGGNGGTGGDGSTANSADHGGRGGYGGTVKVDGSWTITTRGDQAHGIWAKSTGGVAGGGGDGGWTGTSAGAGGNATDGGSVEVTSNGTIQTRGADAYGIYAQSVGGFGGDGGSGTSIFYASGGSGASAGSGGDVTVTNGPDGTIKTTGLRSHGIFAQSVGGGGGTGGSGGALVGLGGSGETGGNGGSATVFNQGTIEALGAEARGIYAQSIGGGGGDGGGAGGLVSIGGKGSTTSDGGEVKISNTGSITASSNAIYAQSIGGGGGSGGSASGWFSFGGDAGSGGHADKVVVSSKGDLTTLEDNASAIFAQSVGGGGGNGGNSTSGGAMASVAIGGDGGKGGNGDLVQVGVDIATGEVDPVTGAIVTLGDFSRGIQAQSIGGGGGNGGFAKSFSVNPGSGSIAIGLGGSGAGGGHAGQVEVYAGDANFSISTDGKDSHGIFAQSVGGGGGSGGFSITGSAGVGVSAAVSMGGTAGKGGDGGSVHVGSETDQVLGRIITQDQHSYGIFAQSVGGGGGDGGYSIAASSAVGGLGGSLSFGGSGGEGGDGNDVTVYNGAEVRTLADDSHGVFAQSVGGGGGSGGYSVAGSLSASAVNLSFGGSGSEGGIGGKVMLHSSGLFVQTFGNHAYGIFGQSVGGGGGDGGFSVSGGISAAPSVGFSMGGSGASGSAGGDVLVESSSNVITRGRDSHAIVAQSVGGGGGTGGFSVATSISVNPISTSATAAVNASIGGAGGDGGDSGDVTLISAGEMIETAGPHSFGLLAQSVGGGGGDGGFSVAASISSGPGAAFSMGGSGAKGGDAGKVYLDSSTNIFTEGYNSDAIVAQSVGGGGGTGGFSVAAAVSADMGSIAASIGGAGGKGGDGNEVRVGHTEAITGTLKLSGGSSSGIVAQSIGGGGGDGGFSVGAGVSSSAAVSFSMGGSGGTAGDGANVLLNSAAVIQTLGLDSHGLFAQSVGGGGGSGGFSVAGGASSSNGAVSAGIGGSGGGGGNGGAVELASAGASVSTWDDRSYAILAQSIGGGGGDGGFSVAGGISSQAAIGFSLGGGGGTASMGSTVTVTNSSLLFTAGDDSHGLFAQSVGGGGGSGGFSVTGGASSSSSSIGASIGGSAGAGGNSGLVKVTNSGDGIHTMGDRSNGIHAQSVGGGGGHGGFSVAGGIGKATSASFSVGGSGGEGGDSGAVEVDNSSEIVTSGEGSTGIFSQSVGGGGGSGGFSLSGTVSSEASGLSFSMGGSGGAAGNGNRVSVDNSGAIFTGGVLDPETEKGKGRGSAAIVAQSIGGGGGNGGFSGSFTATLGQSAGNGLSISIGGDGSGGGDAGEVELINSGEILTTADDSIGLFAQSVGGGGGNGGFSLSAALSAGQQKTAFAVSIGGNGGSGGHGADVSLTNANTVTTVGNHSQGIFAQSIGGGGGNGGFSASWSMEVGDQAKSLGVSVGGAGSNGGNGGEVIVTNTGAITTFGDFSSAIQAQSIGGGGGDGGFSVAGSMAGPESKSLAVSVGGQGGVGGKGGAVTVLGNGGENPLETHGYRAAGVSAQSIGGGGGNGGFSAAMAFGVGGNDPNQSSTSIGVSVGGSGGSGNTGGTVHVGKEADRLTGDILTTGLDSAGILAQSIGGGGGTGGYSLTGSVNLNAGQQGPNTNMAISVGGGGGSGNDGGEVSVFHTGSVYTAGDGSYGIQAQSIGGGGGNGGSSRSFVLQLGTKPDPTGPGGKPTKEEKEAGSANKALALAVGGYGAGGGDGAAVVVDHIGDITTEGADAHGIFAQSIGGGGGNGGDAHQGFDGQHLLKPFDRTKFAKNVQIVVGGSGGASGHGGSVDVINDGHITTYGAGSHGVFAQSIGGGGGSGGAGVEGALGRIGVGGGTGSTGNGQAVNITVNGSIDTFEDASYGIFAQSIGGGGGAAGNVDRGFADTHNVGIGLAFGQDGAGGGDGGKVTINSTADITTRGTASSGIFAQSIGGGGGVTGSLGNDVDELPFLSVLNFAGSVGGDGSGGDVSITQEGRILIAGDAANGIFAQSAGGKDLGGDVTVKVTGDILTQGEEANAIFAQSRGDAGAGDVSVEIVSGIIQGGSNTGAAVRIADGENNSLSNAGTIQTFDWMDGVAIVGGSGNERVDNKGIVRGSVSLGEGANAFTHQAGALLESGAFVDLGEGNLFSNAGTISTGGVGYLQDTLLTGDFTQTGEAIWNFDITSEFTSDLFAISGVADLGVYTNIVNLHAMDLAGSEGTYTLITADSGLTGAFKFGTYTGGPLPVGYTYTLENSETEQLLHLSESAGPFYWRGGAGNVWNGAFIDGQSNWTSDLAGEEFIYGTPGVNCDVFFSGTHAETAHRETLLGADFAINSLTITDPESVGIYGEHTLTLAAAGGQGITITPGAAEAVVDVNIELGASQTWTHDGSELLYITGDTITGSGFGLTFEGTGTTAVGAAIQTGTGFVTKDGSGALLLYQASNYSGGTTLNEGLLQAANHDALGIGDVHLNGGVLMLVNDPMLAANTALTVNVGGNYDQQSAAELNVRIIGPSGVNDHLDIDGTATLSGAFRTDYSSLGYNPIPPAGNYTDVFHILHADLGVTGTFSSFIDPYYNGDYLLRWEPVYKTNDVYLLWNQHPFTELNGLTSNQLATATVLNQAVGLPKDPVPTPYNESTGPALDAHPGLRPAIDYLNTRSLALLPTDYDLIAPEELSALFDYGRAFTQIQTFNIENRLREIRHGGGSGFSDRGFNVQKRYVSLDPANSGAGAKASAKEADVFSPGPDNRWGVFISGSVQALDVGESGNARGFDLDTSGITIGVDYRPTDHFAVGVFQQYSNSKADLTRGGFLKMEGTKTGAYATFYDSGFYLNGMLSGGVDSYQSQRAALNGYATGNTGGWGLDAMLSTGYESKVGNFSFGPLASIVFSHQELNDFTERGSMLPLHIENQDESSLASRIGLEASYEHKIGSVTLVPQISLAWQHEFLRGTNEIVSSFAAGPGQPFGVFGPEIGRDSLDVRAGLDIRWTPDFTTYLSYQTEIGRTNYQINSGTVGFQWKF